MSAPRIRSAAVFLALAAAAACEISPLELTNAPSGRVLVRASAPQVWQGTEVELEVTAFDADGERLPSPDVRWTSSNPAVLTLHQTEAGVVARGVAPGTAVVIATVDGVQGSLLLKVEFGGEIRLRYSGARSGEFHAAGPGSGNDRAAWATRTGAMRVPEVDALVILGMQMHADGTADALQLGLYGLASPGSEWKFPASCAEGDRCVEWVELVFGVARSEADLEAQTAYAAHAGSLTLVTLESGRVAARIDGTFCERQINPSSTPCDPATGQGLLQVTGTVDVLVR